MNPIKLIGGGLILLGVIFRAISLAYFGVLARGLPPGDVRARHRFETKKRNALWIDACFVIAGFYVLIR